MFLRSTTAAVAERGTFDGIPVRELLRCAADVVAHGRLDRTVLSDGLGGDVEAERRRSVW